MMKKVTLVLFLFFVANSLIASKNYTVFIDGFKKSTFNSFTLNGTEYIDLVIVSNAFFTATKPVLNRFEITGEDKKINFSPSSMFFKFETNQKSEVFQMRQPTVYYQKRLLIPFNSFLLALEVLSIYKVEHSFNIIKLTKFKEPQPDKLLELAEKLKSKPEPINDTEKEKIVTNNNKIASKAEEIDLIINDKNIVIKKEVQISDEKINNEIDSIINEMDELINSKKEIQNYFRPNAEIVTEFADDSKIDFIEKEPITSPEIKPEISPKDNITQVIDSDVVNNNGHFEKNEPKAHVRNEPNVYSLPSNLNRGDLAKDYNRVLIADSKNTSIYATKNNELDTKLQIIKISAEKKSDCTEIHFYSNLAIENYHKPDCDGKSMKVRLPNATDKITDFSMVNKVFPIKKITSEVIRDILVYTIHFSASIKECKSKRIGPKEIVYTVYPVDMKESTTYKPQDIKIERKDDSPVEKTEPEKKQVVNLDNHKKKWELDVIVLDPGHGGHDAGAVGVTGIYEKDITLKLARKVKELLAESMPNAKVILTREDDRFIELFKRGQIANQAGGKLFISIHLNAAAKKPSPARGVETYILRPGRNDDAVRVANFENSVIKFEKQQDMYKHLNDEQIIIATMAQSAFVQFSEKLAKHVQEEVVRTTKLEDRGVKQAGFYVLVGASMPNILFEACFLSNPDDEKFANSAEGQEKIASGLAKAIKMYSDEYMK